MAQTQQPHEQAAKTFTAANDLLWDSWMQSLGMMTWATDQAEKLVRTWMDQGRVTRDEGVRLQREMIEQARTNQRELQTLIEQSVRENTEALRASFQQQTDELRARFEQLNDEFRAWREKASAAK